MKTECAITTTGYPTRFLILLSLILTFTVHVAVPVAQCADLTVLEVSDEADFISWGDPGGPFDPAMKSYDITNTSDSLAVWGVVTDTDWVQCEPEWGQLPAGESVTVTVSLTEEANNLLSGEYVAILTFTDIMKNEETVRNVSLTVSDTAGILSVSPTGTFSSSGEFAGPFTPESSDYELSNDGGLPLFWSIGPVAEWLEVSADFGRLDPNDSETITLSLTEVVNTMEVGFFSETITFSNLSTGEQLTRTVTLTVRQESQRLAEMFGSNNDLAFSTIRFRPDGSSMYYKPCYTSAIKEFPVDPAGGTYLNLWNDDFAEVVLTDGGQVSLFGTGYNRLFIGSNDWITSMGCYHHFV